MQYRDFKGIDWKPSALGFGMMRLPTLGDDESNIDEEEATGMLRYAIDHGVNYVDTAWPYHGGESEKFVGRALENGYREKVKLATKMPSWEIESQDDLDEYFDKQLERLKTDHIDFYLLHALSEKRWKKYVEIDVFEWIEKVLEEEMIDYIGFSFHDDLDTFKTIVDGYDWDFCQIQYNYLDQEFQAGKEGLKYAADRGMGVIIMEPLRGGELAQEPPEQIKRIWEKSDRNWSPVEWALHWLWNQPEVSLVLSGMSTMDQVKENVQIADGSLVNKLSDSDMELIARAKAKYEELSPIGCTGCNYCMPCPEGVAIPGNFSLYNQAEAYGNYGEKLETYKGWNDKRKASNCVSCRQCEEKCPQNLPIADLMDKVAEYFEG